MEKCFAFKEQAAVDFVGQAPDVAVADDLGNLFNISALHHSAGWVLRRIQNDEFGAVGDQGCEFVHVE